ncbi:MAG: response regulator transcription factor [Oscillibacter sp.]|nr:response regulator transcription factor [Oscillibacter sp.]
MIRIGICDDNAGARIALEAAVERALERRRSGGAAFFHFSSGEGILQWLDKHAGEMDLVFLDIEMGGLDGMETARRIRAADGSLAMVFVTGYSDYVFDGYAVGALGYLMKPPKPEALDDVLERAALLRLRDEDSVFVCRSGETLYRIPKKSILYFRSERRQIACVAQRRTYVFYGKLDETEASVGEGFVRIHQRYLVRAGAVERMESTQVVLSSGEALPVSRACRAGAMAALAREALEG